MTILIYKMLLGVLIIAVILATLDRSVLVFIEESIPIIKKQQEQEIEGFFGRKLRRITRRAVNKVKNKLTNPKTRIKENPPPPANPLSSSDVALLYSLEFADAKKDMAVSDYKSFCLKTSDNLDDLEKRCGNLEPQSCKRVDCCVLLNGIKCVSGGRSGPNFGWKKTNGDSRPQRMNDYYYYKNKTYR